ncbi:MAG TPA: hypothetical protein PLQ57_08225 [Saprospiraceae bacterium]|nr:hypothetical protein [Saprospiraceae bacterium]HRG21004.1 hypothetical protein [Saprospiraceae bacterium]
MSLHILTEPNIQIDPEILAELTNETEEAGQVVLHILYNTPMNTFMNIRIWPTTYLFDQHSNHRSELVHVENICLYPNWMPCFPGEKFHFTLIFSGLPKNCTVFDFIEVCDNEAGAFEARGLHRNATDVYFLEVL